jgi:hypothetical protein
MSESKMSEMIQHRKNKAPRTPPHFIAALFRFYRVCGVAGCARARRCNRDDAPCFARLWPHVTERDKLAVRAMFTAIGTQQPIAQVLAAGEAALARWDADHAAAPQDASHDASAELAIPNVPGDADIKPPQHAARIRVL